MASPGPRWRELMRASRRSATSSYVFCREIGPKRVLSDKRTTIIRALGRDCRLPTAGLGRLVRRQRRDLEAVDIDEAAVGDLQLRDHGEGEEAHRLKGRRIRATERFRRLDARARRLDHLDQRRIRKEA